MFRITADINIDGFKPFKCTAATWKRSINEMCDTAKVYLPTYCRLKKAGDQYTEIPTAQAFTEGTAITIEAGYDYSNETRFKGFIKRINFTSPLEIECEGYSYLLGKITVNKTYTNSTVKQILQDLSTGTTIKVSADIPDIPVVKAVFINQTGLDVLQWFRQKMKLYCYFNFDTLYCGGQAFQDKGTINHKLGWNTIKDSQLMFNTEKEFDQVNIVINARDVTGEMKKIKRITTYPNDKIVRVEGYNPNDPYLQTIRDELQKQLDYKGYSGSITTFLEPYAEPGMASSITDDQYPDRNGVYFIESVEGELSASRGGRQKIGIGFKL
jgi:hypothetical protein